MNICKTIFFLVKKSQERYQVYKKNKLILHTHLFKLFTYESDS